MSAPPPPPPPPKRMMGGGPSGLIGGASRRGIKSSRNTLGSLYAQYADASNEKPSSSGGVPDAPPPPPPPPSGLSAPPFASSVLPPPPAPAHPSGGVQGPAFSAPPPPPAHFSQHQKGPTPSISPKPAKKLFAQEFSPEPLEEDIHTMNFPLSGGLAVPTQQQSQWMPTPPPSSSDIPRGHLSAEPIAEESPSSLGYPIEAPPPQPSTLGLNVEDARFTAAASEGLPLAPLPPPPPPPPPHPEREDVHTHYPPPVGAEINEAAANFTMHHGATVAPTGRVPTSRSGSTGSNRGSGGPPLVSRVTGAASLTGAGRSSGNYPLAARPRSSSRQHTPRSPAAAAAAAALLAQEGGEDAFAFPSASSTSASVSAPVSQLGSHKTAPMKAAPESDMQPMLFHREREEAEERVTARTSALASAPVGVAAGGRESLKSDTMRGDHLSIRPSATSSLLSRNSALRSSSELPGSGSSTTSGIAPRAATSSRAREQLSQLLSINVPSFTRAGSSSASSSSLLPGSARGATGSFLFPRATGVAVAGMGAESVDARGSPSRSETVDGHSFLGIRGGLGTGAASSIRHAPGDERRMLESVLRRKPFDIPSFNPPSNSKGDLLHPTNRSINNTGKDTHCEEGGKAALGVSVSFTRPLPIPEATFFKDVHASSHSHALHHPSAPSSESTSAAEEQRHRLDSSSHPNPALEEPLPSGYLAPPSATNKPVDLRSVPLQPFEQLGQQQEQQHYSENNMTNDKQNPPPSTDLHMRNGDLNDPLYESSSASDPTYAFGVKEGGHDHHDAASVSQEQFLPRPAAAEAEASVTAEAASVEMTPFTGESEPLPLPDAAALPLGTQAGQDVHGPTPHQHSGTREGADATSFHGSIENTDGEIAISFETDELPLPPEGLSEVPVSYPPPPVAPVTAEPEPEPVVNAPLPPLPVPPHAPTRAAESSAARELSQGGGPAVMPSSMATPLHYSRPPSQPMHFPTSSGSQRVSDSPYPVPPPSSLHFSGAQDDLPVGEGAAPEEAPVVSRPPLLPPSSTKPTSQESKGLFRPEMVDNSTRVQHRRLNTGALFGIFMPKGKGVLVVHQKRMNERGEEVFEAKRNGTAPEMGQQDRTCKVQVELHSMQQVLGGMPSDGNRPDGFRPATPDMHRLARFKPTAVGRAYWQMMAAINRYSPDLSQQSLSTSDNNANPAAPLLDLEKGENLLDALGDELDPSLRAVLKVYLRDALCVTRGGEGKLKPWGKGGRDTLVEAVLNSSTEEDEDEQDMDVEQDPDFAASRHFAAVPYDVYRSTSALVAEGPWGSSLPPPLLPNIQDSDVQKRVLRKVEDLLCRGQREAAAALAVENGLYTDAMILSILCPNAESLQRTVEAYTTRCLHPATPLAQAYRKLNELPCAFLPSVPFAFSRLHGNRRNGDGVLPFQASSLSSSPPSLRHTWQHHAAVQISGYNATSIDHLLRLSDSLAGTHELQAAHACLLLCDMCLTLKKKSSSRKSDSVMTASVENSIQRDETLSQVSSTPLDTSRSNGLSKAEQQRFAQRQELQRRLSIFGGLYYTKKRSGFLSPLTTTLTTVLQACRRGLDEQHSHSLQQGAETVPVHGIPSRDLRYAIALQCMTALWLREVGMNDGAHQIFVDIARQITMTPLHTGEGSQWIPASLNHLVFLLGNLAIPAPTEVLPQQVLQQDSSDSAAAPPPPPTSPPSGNENMEPLQPSLSPAPSLTTPEERRPAASPAAIPPAAVNPRQPPPPPPQMPPPSSHTSTPPPPPVTGIVSSNRRKELVPPEPPKPKRLGVVAAAPPAPPPQDRDMKQPPSQNSAAAPESSGESKSTRPNRKTESSADSSSGRKRASSLDAIKNFFFRGRSQSATDGKKDADGKEKEEVKKMILDTEKPPKYDPVSGRWLFEQTEEEKAQAEAIKRGPPKMNPATIPAATAAAAAANVGSSNAGAAPPPPSGISAGPGRPGAAGLRRTGLQRRPGGPLRPQYPDMFNST